MQQANNSHFYKQKKSCNTFLITLMGLLSTLLISACDSEGKLSNNISNTLKEEPSLTLVSVVDDAGTVITLDKPATRIIALAPHIVENVYSAGAGDLLVASVNYANYPPDAEKLPKVGGYNKFNIEAIAALKPDVIFAWQSGTPNHFFDKIKQLGIPLYLDEPSTIEEVATSIVNIGELTGKQEQAKKVAQQHLNDLATLQQIHEKKSPITVFYQVWDDPIYTINGKQIISDVLRLCGGINIYANETIKAPIINLESIIDRNPEVIMTGSSLKAASKSLDRWKKWPNLSAVKHNNLFVVNADTVSRHTTRIIQGTQEVCEKLDIARENLKKGRNKNNN